MVRDLRLTPMVFDILGLEMTRERARDLLADLDAIHNTRSPPSHGGADLDPDSDT